MSLRERIEEVFAHRAKPTEVVVVTSPYEMDSDLRQALWFADHDWRDIAWEDWQEHSNAIFFLAPEAFAYYLPSLLLLSAENPRESLTAADSLINQLDRSPDMEGWTEGFSSRFLGMNLAELDVLKEWLLQVCEYAPYRGWGIAASGPGDTFGRAYDTVDLLQKEIERRAGGPGLGNRR
jgi:hypothetical protein